MSTLNYGVLKQIAEGLPVNPGRRWVALGSLWHRSWLLYLYSGVVDKCGNEILASMFHLGGTSSNTLFEYKDLNIYLTLGER